MTNPNDPNEIPNDGIPNDVPPAGQPPMGDPQSNQPPGVPNPNAAYTPQQVPGAENKIVAGVCGIFLGAFGVHKFILGYTTEGIIMLSVSLGGILLSCLVLPIFATIAMEVIGLAEGIIYLTKTDLDFVNTYVKGRKPWF